MVDTVTFRTTDGTRWGTGQNSDLSATQIDINFWTLHEAILGVQTDITSGGAGIDYFSVVGRNLFVTLTDHTVLGPYVLPVAQWNFRGPWEPITIYDVMDVVTENGATYLVIFAHTSQATFNAGANDGSGHDFYGLLLAQPQDELPAGGTVGQVLAKATGSPYNTEWTTLTRNLALYIEGKPTASELLLQYVCPEEMTLPLTLVGSIAIQGTETTAAVSYGLYKNGVAIGSVNFLPSPADATFTLTEPVQFNPGDVLTIVGPATPDANQANISITLVALLP